MDGARHRHRLAGDSAGSNLFAKNEVRDRKSQGVSEIETKYLIQSISIIFFIF